MSLKRKLSLLKIRLAGLVVLTLSLIVGFQNCSGYTVSSGTVNSPGNGSLGASSNVMAMTSGSGQNCLVNGANELMCWGLNSLGQAGIQSSLFVSVPTLVSNLASGTLTSVAAGDLHTCAVASGHVYCFGDNQSGQLGTPSATSLYSITPIQVPGLSNVTALALGTQFSCALETNGQVQCWGANGSGQLGNASTVQSTNPVFVMTAPNTPLTGVSQISARGSQVCALVTSISGEAVYCWGYNYYGQLGNNSTTNSDVAVLVASLGGGGVTPTSVSVGNDHACALLTSGQVQCWGYNYFGQLGNGQYGSTASSLVPVYVNSLTTATAIISGGDHSCAIENSGQVVCWGQNNNGQLGLGSVQDISEPQEPIANLSNVVLLSAGSNYTCASTSNSQVSCWGSNVSDQLGNSVATYSLNSVPVNGSVSTLTSVSSLSVSDTGYGCASAKDSSGVSLLQCWGNNTYGQLGDGYEIPSAGAVSTALVGVNEVTTGADQACALMPNGSVECWGLNQFGQLGSATLDRSLIPISVVSSGVTQVSSGDNYVCVVTTAGNVKCWGLNSYGQLGGGTIATPALNPNPTPVVVETAANTPLTNVVSISTAPTFACAVVSPNGNVYCWGQNNAGQLGNGKTTTSAYAIEVLTSSGGAPLTGVSQIVSSDSHVCAVTTASSQVQCWGTNFYGQLGNGATTNSLFPVQVSLVPLAAGETIKMISAASNSNCVVGTLGDMQCWGQNISGQLGTQSTSLAVTSPVMSTVVGSTVSSVSMGNNYACAILSSGQAECWGAYGVGALGSGVKLFSTIPVRIAGF